MILDGINGRDYLAVVDGSVGVESRSRWCIAEVSATTAGSRRDDSASLLVSRDEEERKEEGKSGGGRGLSTWVLLVVMAVSHSTAKRVCQKGLPN